jgi:hypothetical protein
MSDMAQPRVRLDQGEVSKGPHLDKALDPEELAGIEFKYEFALTCASEARNFPAGSDQHKENLNYAREFLDAALDAVPSDPRFHFSRGLISAELGDTTSAVSSFRNAIIYNPAGAPQYMSVLQMGSEAINGSSPGTISSTTLRIQSLIASGNYEGAFSAAHTNINGNLLRYTEPNLWNVQLMRVAAMQIGAERAYVETLNVLEQRGLLNAQDREYLPVGYKLTQEMRQEMRDEAAVGGANPARSKIWEDLKIRDIAPINSTAVNVGPKANENH